MQPFRGTPGYLAHSPLRTLGQLLAAALVVGVVGLPSTQAQATGPAQAGRSHEIHESNHHDLSPRLRDIAAKPLPRGHTVKTEYQAPAPTGAPLADPAVQSTTIAPPATITAPAAAAPALISGVGSDMAGFSVASAPPDTNGDLGPNNYVQVVNSALAVFSRSGAKTYGPVPTNTVFQGFGGGCETNDDGDATVKYDQAADRWVIQQFSVTTTPYLECVAVSRTGDPTGQYARYSIPFSYFPDYPKLGVWADGYYESFNEFSGSTFVDAKACAEDRNAMISNAATASVICFATTHSDSLLPADLDGHTLPPAGSPAYFMGLESTSSLALYKFHADFTTPANSSLSTPVSIPVSGYAQACGGGSCIPQTGTSTKLDSLGDRIMYRLSYRNFGDHESLVASHAVANGAGSAVRWYEIRNPGATAPTVTQQSTYAPSTPSGMSRWLSSAAMDHVGDIALGYSTSSSSTHPGISFASRLATDPVSTMRTETAAFTGGGSQAGSVKSPLTRWGDYSSMSVDPVDDCTFWYTTEFIPSNGTFNWATKIVPFKLAGCTAPQVTSAPAAYSFGSVVRGDQSSAPVVTLSNPGTAPLNVTSLSLTGPSASDFAITSTLPIAVPAGGTAPINVRFAPMGVAPSVATLNVATDASTRPQTAALSGTGVTPTLTRYPYLTDTVGQYATVNWATDSPQASALSWGPAGSCTAHTVAATSTPITVDTKSEYQWQAQISGLGSGQSYCYTVSQNSASLLGTTTPSFTSAVAAGDSKPFTFAVFGDFGEATGGVNNHQANVMAQIASSGAQFVIGTGDTAYDMGTQTQYGDLLNSGGNSEVFLPNFWKAPGQSLPLFNAIGNHGYNQTFLDVWPQSHAVSASSGSYTVDSTSGDTRAWYAFDEGNVRMYMLDGASADSNYATDANAHWQASSAEYGWLKADLAAHPNALKMAVWHYPLYSDGFGGSDTALQGTASLQGLLDQYGVKLAFNGHSHDYERNVPDAAGLVSYVSGGGGADTSAVAPCSTFDAYARGWSNTTGSSCVGNVPSSEAQVHHFLKVTVNGSQVTVTPTDETGSTFDSTTYTFAPPAVPTGLTATAKSGTSNEIDLTWTGSSGASSYTLSRSTTSGGPYTVVTSALGPAATSFADTGLSAGTSYYYILTASNAGGTSPASTPASTATNPVAPAVPAGLTATAKPGTSNEIDLTWTSTPGATSYALSRSTASGGPYTTVTSALGSAATSYADTALNPATSYYYVLTASNAGGTSPASTPASTATNPVAPAVPAGLTATAKPGTSNEIDLTWTSSPGATSYTLNRSTASGGPYTAVKSITSGTTSSVSDVGLRPSSTYYYVVFASNSGGSSGASPEAKAVTNPAAGDYDGTGHTELGIYRPSTGEWYIQNQVTGAYRVYGWGTSGDIPVPADYDGTGHTELGIYRPSTGEWYIQNQVTGAYRVYGWGTSGDIPVPADYDGTGHTELGIYRPSTGEWYIQNQVTGAYRVYGWGTSGDIPVPADYDGTGHTELGIYRPSTGEWYIQNQVTGAYRVYGWGTSGDIPVPADYDGTGHTELGIYRPSTGEWYIQNQVTGAYRVYGWGTSGDIPVPADYDGTGHTELGIYRPSTGEWYIQNQVTGAYRVYGWGTSGDIPVTRQPGRRDLPYP